MQKLAFQTRIVRAPSDPTNANDLGNSDNTLDPVALHVLLKKQVSHTAVAVVSVYAALKTTDVLATAAKRIIKTKIK